ncbi:hypothetical protein SPURM210S_04118 [Streptomyces purpurascens]
MEGPGTPHGHGRGECEAQPLPVAELQRGRHGQDQHGQREQGGDDQAVPFPPCALVIVAVIVRRLLRRGRLGQGGGVAGLLDGGDEFLRTDVRRMAHARHADRQIDCRGDPVQLAELLSRPGSHRPRRSCRRRSGRSSPAPPLVRPPSAVSTLHAVHVSHAPATARVAAAVAARAVTGAGIPGATGPAPTPTAQDTAKIRTTGSRRKPQTRGRRRRFPQALAHAARRGLLRPSFINRVSRSRRTTSLGSRRTVQWSDGPSGEFLSVSMARVTRGRSTRRTSDLGIFSADLFHL